MPKSRYFEFDTLLLAQALAQFAQGQIRLLLDPRPHLLFSRGQAGNTVAADRSATALATGLEAAFYLINPYPADLQTPGDIDWSFAAFQSAQHSVT